MNLEETPCVKRLRTFLFQLCCSAAADGECPDSGAWSAAPIVGSDASSVTLDSTCSDPSPFLTGLRYAWRESPCDLELCAVYGVDNDLPAPPYIFNGLIGRK